MARAFLLPDLGEGLTEGEVARWLVTEGQVVAEDDPLVEIQTDKATVEIPSPYAGTVLRIVVPEGQVAPVGARLVVIGEPGEAVDEPASEAPSGTSVTRRSESAGLRAGSRSGDAVGAEDRHRARGGPRHRLCDRSGRAYHRGRRSRGCRRRVGGGRREPLRGVRR